MQGKTCSKKGFLVSIIASMLIFSSSGSPAEEVMPAPQPEAEIEIVKYGSISVRCSEPGARVYVDDTYKGSGDTVIEGIVAGDHLVSCKTDDKTVSGLFQVKKNETLKLEARFDEGKLVFQREPARVPEVVEKKKPQPAKQEKPKKPVAEPKKVEQKNPVEERRKTHFNVIRLDYRITDAQDIKVEQDGNKAVISKYDVNKNKTGKYYRTKQGVLLCDAGPCELTWTVSFIYTDETNKADALLLKWKETIFNGITPTGTSRQDLECCLNGQCWRMQDNNTTDTTQEFEIGRYRLAWNKTSVLIRRSDIMKEILEAGRSLDDY
jgi:hypothetical protein